MNERLSEYRNAKKKQRELDYNNRSKDRLKAILNKKITTSFIGSISTFEEIFGHLWGQGVKWENKTDEQKEYAEKWQLARSEILRKGNGQIRQMEKEVDENEVIWTGQKIQLIPME